MSARQRGRQSPFGEWVVAVSAVGLTAAWLLVASLAWAENAVGRASASRAEQSEEGGVGQADEIDGGALVADGYRLLDGGDHVGAEEAFLAALRVDPTNLEAREGLVWTYVRRGDFERAAESADARLALDPDGAWWDQWLAVISLCPSRRDEAIALYQEQVEASPSALEPRLCLAELLSWTTSRRREAIAVYREAVAIDPSSIEARVGLASVLAWEGERAEANAIFDGILDEQPNNVEAMLGRAGSARWDGDWDTARGLLDRALEVAPDDARLSTERVQLELDPALRAADVAVADELAERRARAEATRPLIGVHPTYSRTSDGLTRLNVLLDGEAYFLGYTRLRLVAGWSRFRDDLDELDRVTFGGELRQGLPLGFYLRGLYLAQLYKGAPNANEWNAQGGLQNPEWPVQFRAGFWQHGIVDELRTHEEIAQLEGVGSGGLTVASMREDVQIRDAYLAVSGSPWAGGYLYGTGAFGWMNDANRRITAGAGLGVDVLHLAGTAPAHELYVKYDYFILAYEAERPDYWSPSGFQAHTPGLAWLWRSAERWIVGAELGAPIDPRDGSVGYLAGAFCRYVVGDPFYVEGRARFVDDTEFAIAAGTLGLVFLF